jgi:hypothetical protein
MAHMSRRFWERFQSLSEIALLVGCILIVVGLVFEDWVASLLGTGEVAVIVGVMIEGLADGGIFIASGKLQMIHESELEHTRLESARLNNETEKLRAVSREFEKALAPRWINSDLAELPIEELRKFAGTPLFIETISIFDDPEPACFAMNVSRVAQRADWSVHNINQSGTWSGKVPISPGVTILTYGRSWILEDPHASDGSSPKARRAAVALEAFLEG